MTPRVSICLPNLNQRPFIEDRMESIVTQTCLDWECVAFDNFSDDGSWEVIRDFAARDAKVHALQAPRNSMYANSNNCIRKAKGDFIYIATSDDTMPPDCLKKMFTALEEHPECEICQCGLQMIDRQGGAPMRGEGGSLCWEKLANASFFGERLKAPHVPVDYPHQLSANTYRFSKASRFRQLLLMVRTLWLLAFFNLHRH